MSSSGISEIGVDQLAQVQAPVRRGELDRVKQLVVGLTLSRASSVGACRCSRHAGPRACLLSVVRAAHRLAVWSQPDRRSPLRTPFLQGHRASAPDSRAPGDVGRQSFGRGAPRCGTGLAAHGGERLRARFAASALSANGPWSSYFASGTGQRLGWGLAGSGRAGLHRGARRRTLAAGRIWRLWEGRYASLDCWPVELVSWDGGRGGRGGVSFCRSAGGLCRGQWCL